MRRISYETTYRDWSYLWSIGPAYDMTGGYEDQNDLASLLKNPTKTVAARCLSSQISYWFQTGTDAGGRQKAEELIKSDPEVRAIYERHVEFLERDEDE